MISFLFVDFGFDMKFDSHPSRIDVLSNFC